MLDEYLQQSLFLAKIICDSQSKDRTLKRDFNDGADFLNALFFEFRFTHLS